jgi:hypothetical protein
VTIAAISLAVAIATGPLPDHASADYAGKVGSSAVRMNLWRHGDQVEGYYLYESRYVVIDLAGPMEPGGHVRLFEKGRPKGAREVFSGMLVGDRFDSLRDLLGDAFIAIELPSSQPSDHSVLTEQRDEDSVRRVIEFFRDKLNP